MTDPLITELIEARKAAGLTQRQVADRMHCVQSHVSMLEAGRTDLQLDTLRRWAGALGLRPAWVPETAPATSVVAGNGAPRLGEGPADEDAPASDPVPVVCGDRADVAHDVTDVGLALQCSCGQWSMLHRNSFGLDAYDEHARHVVRRQAVARTLDVAEATADKARAVGLARETAS
jgi:transcriptional regulator with XRE-family HTH domain